jgi:uncharacterized protein with PIN domain
MPEGDRCPVCDAPTLRVAHAVWNRVAPFFRTSWCHACGWEGMLRHGAVTPHAPERRAEPAGRGR